MKFVKNQTQQTTKTIHPFRILYLNSHIQLFSNSKDHSPGKLHEACCRHAELQFVKSSLGNRLDQQAKSRVTFYSVGTLTCEKEKKNKKSRLLLKSVQRNRFSGVNPQHQVPSSKVNSLLWIQHISKQEKQYLCPFNSQYCS